jgi:isoquinoline 1-oxidoreductase alpha subunit
VITIDVNGVSRQIDIEPDTPLLWVLRDVIGLTGTKFGCGIAQCGACTVHINGAAMRSCSVPIGALNGAKVVTIEGLSPDNNHPVQELADVITFIRNGWGDEATAITAAQVAKLRKTTDPTSDRVILLRMR